MWKVCGIPLVVGLLCALPAGAQIPVTDVGNAGINTLQLGQNTLQALRALVSNANEVTMVQNQLKQLINEAKELAALPLSLVNEIDQALKTYSDLLNTGQGLSYQVNAVVGQFESLYGQLTTGGGSGSYLDRAKRLVSAIRDAGRLSAQASAIFDRICAQQTRIGQLMASSAAAGGNLQATQSGNQLLGVLAEQQASIQQILATNSRLGISTQMQQLVQQDQAAQNAQQYLMLAAPPTDRPNQGFLLPE